MVKEPPIHPLLFISIGFFFFFGVLVDFICLARVRRQLIFNAAGQTTHNISVKTKI
jgi:hypothetical protein